MAVDFKKKVAGKTTKLVNKSLEGNDLQTVSPILEGYGEGTLYKIPLSSIAADPNQPRKYFNVTKLQELADSIKSKGVLQPIIIRKNDLDQVDTEFLIIAGERRFRASKLAGLEQLPAIFTNGDPAEIALIENLQRDDLKPIEEAEAYARIMESHGYTHEKLSVVVGKARSTITELLALNKLPEEIKENCRTSDNSKNVLLEIAKRKDPKEMLFLYNKVKNEDFTVAKIRQLTRPKAVRQTTSIEQRLIIKIKEARRLIPKINSSDISEIDKEKLREELSDFHKIMTDLLAK